GGARSACRSVADPVAGAGDGLDRGRIAQLAAEPADRDLDDLAVGIDVLVPAAVEQLPRRDGGAVGGEEELEHGELLRAELEAATGAARDPLDGVEPDVPARQDRREGREASAGER